MLPLPHPSERYRLDDGNQPGEVPQHSRCITAVAYDDEYGVVSRQGAGDGVEAATVDVGGNAVGISCPCMHDHDIACHLEPLETVFAQRVGHFSGQFREVCGVFRQDIAIPLRTHHLGGLQTLQVARQCGLRDVVPGLFEFSEQGVLGVDFLVRQDVTQCFDSVAFHFCFERSVF